MEEVNNNPDVILKKYEIITNYLEKDDEKEKQFDLPTPESIQKLCEPQIVKDLLIFDIVKYASCFEGDKLNMNKIESIKDAEMTKFLLMFLGYINSKNDIYSLYDDDSMHNPDEKSYIDNSSNYLVYLNMCIDYLKQNNKFLNTLTDIDILLKILSDVGITIQKEDKNDLFTKIKKDLFLSNENNKILILLAPSNNFWIKSEKTVINDINYDKKLNNYSNIFYNKKFIKKFLEQVVSNPRCNFGLISSMTYKNLKACWEALGKIDNEINELYRKTIIYIDQNLHDQGQEDPKNKKKSFFRNMNKIIEYLKKDKKNKNNDQDNTGYFKETNILILESELDKMTDTTRYNTIRLNIFNEEFLQKDEKGKTAIELETDKFIQYLVKLLNNCDQDIRAYIKENPY